MAIRMADPARYAPDLLGFYPQERQIDRRYEMTGVNPYAMNADRYVSGLLTDPTARAEFGTGLLQGATTDLAATPVDIYESAVDMAQDITPQNNQFNYYTNPFWMLSQSGDLAEKVSSVAGSEALGEAVYGKPPEGYGMYRNPARVVGGVTGAGELMLGKMSAEAAPYVMRGVNYLTDAMPRPQAVTPEGLLMDVPQQAPTQPQTLLMESDAQGVAPQIRASDLTPEEAIQIEKKLPYIGSEDFSVQEIAGKKVVFVPADMLDYGRMYEGLAEAPIPPRPLKGGSGYGTLKSSQMQGLGFASLDPKIAKKIAESDADYMMVSTMRPIAHRSNIDFANIVHNQLNAYVNEGFITPANKKQIASNLSKKFEGMPDVFSPEGLEWLKSQSFDTRASVMDTLDQAGYRKLGAPPISKIIRETINPVEAGYPVGHGSVLVKINKDMMPQDIRTVEGGLAHPSYPIGIYGDPVAQIPYGVRVEDIFDEYINYKLASGSNLAGARRALSMGFRTAEMTPERVAAIPTAQPQVITSARQAQLYSDIKNDTWRSTVNPVNQGENPIGLGAAEIIRAIEDNQLSASLSRYSQKEIDQKAKTGELVFYALGHQQKANGTGGQIYFGLNRNTDYADMYGATSPELTPNEVSIVSVMNNEAGNVGKGMGGASILKAIQEGATTLDAYAVPTAKNKDGFLPDYYSQFGFEEVDRIPYDEKFLRDPEFGGSEEKFKKITRQWKSTGWDESLGYPDLVIMKWKGDDNVRPNATQYFSEGGSEALRGQAERFVATARGNLGSSATKSVEQPPRTGILSDEGTDTRGLRDDRRGMGSSLQRGLLELQSLDPVSKRALGLLQ